MSVHWNRKIKRI